jgi:predicted nucleotidyltransferase
MASDRIERVLTAGRELSNVLPGVVAIGLVGSYARGTARPDSDVDVVLLTEYASEVLARTDWFGVFDPGALLVRSGDFGAIQERRLRLPDSTVVEVGVGHPDWADTAPVDDGTRRVVSDGLVVLHDPQGLLTELMHAVARSEAES